MNARVSGLESPVRAVAAEAQMPPCLIVNPRSFSASRGLAASASALALSQGAEVVTVDGPASLRAAVESILARRQRTVMMLAGDGTVCAIVDQLSNLLPGAWTPDLLILPGGRTNLTAADLGTGGHALATLKRALSNTADPRRRSVVEERCALRIEQSPAPARHGFFLSAALIDSATRQCHQRRTDRDEHGALTTLSYLLKLGVLALFGRSGLECPTLSVDAGERGTQQGRVRLLMATTLMHRKGLFNPYAPRGQGDVRMMSVSRDAPGVWRSLPRLLTGRYSKAMNAEKGYLSGRCEHVQITGLTGYMLDGEPFDADPTRPVTITAGPRLRFLKP
ncbi:MAG: diacylglycerol kinase family protein [Burkholderiaceae bacterium]|nr:diacylglycerol kinase family protein [Burkholderiaceae bacterium]